MNFLLSTIFYFGELVMFSNVRTTVSFIDHVNTGMAIQIRRLSFVLSSSTFGMVNRITSARRTTYLAKSSTTFPI